MGNTKPAADARHIPESEAAGDIKEATLMQRSTPRIIMFSQLLDIDLQKDYAAPYEENRAAYLLDAEALKKATGPYKAARDAYVAATATFTKSLYE